MAKLLARLAIPGQTGCPGFVTITCVPDRELDSLGIWKINKTVVIGLPEKNDELRNDVR